jgi:hypothetical protein
MGSEWVEAEMETLEAKDARVKRRIVRMIEQFSANPEASIPKACGNAADTKASYRALSSDAVSAEEVRGAHARAAVGRARVVGRVLVPSDTTDVSFGRDSQIQGLGPVGRKGERGLMVHTAMMTSREGVPLGIAYQQVWAREDGDGKRQTRRKRLIEEKESFRWLETVDAIESLLPAEVEAWVSGDRESDIFELFAMPRRAGLELVVRATHDRKVQGEHGYLHAAVEAAEMLGEMEVEVPRSRKRKARTARLRVQACGVTLEPPRNHLGRGDLSPVEVNVVRVVEQETVPAGEEPIEWMIITTVGVDGLSDAVEVVGAYAQRWKVERYHYVLKSGCGVEKLQLENTDRIERALALYNVVAWRLLYMTYVARVAPEVPCTAVLEEEEWRTLCAMSTKKPRPVPKEPPTVREAVRMIAMLGGFLGRKGDGDPGVQSIWTGFRRLMDFTFALQRLRLPETCG